MLHVCIPLGMEDMYEELNQCRWNLLFLILCAYIAAVTSVKELDDYMNNLTDSWLYEDEHRKPLSSSTTRPTHKYKCNTVAYKLCANGDCIQRRQRCREDPCTYPNQEKCDDGRSCVSPSEICNNILNCRDLSDESHCGGPLVFNKYFWTVLGVSMIIIVPGVYMVFTYCCRNLFGRRRNLRRGLPVDSSQQRVVVRWLNINHWCLRAVTSRNGQFTTHTYPLDSSVTNTALNVMPLLSLPVSSVMSGPPSYDEANHNPPPYSENDQCLELPPSYSDIYEPELTQTSQV